MGFLRRNDGLDGTRSQTRQKPLAVGSDRRGEPGDPPRAFEVEVEVPPGQNHALTVAATVCMDEMALAAALHGLSRMDSR